MIRNKYATIRRQALILFYIAGIGAFIWFLIRVIPKPSRATYPCQRAAFPLACGFIIHLTGIISASLLYKKGINVFKKNRPVSLLMIIAAFALAIFAGAGTGIKQLRADRKTEQGIESANQPVGIARGIIPGRVVWVWNPEAVNEDCPNTWLENDNWWMEHNTDRTRVHDMLESSLCLLTASDNATDSWDKIFRYHNREHNKGDIPYQEGEKICIKSNFVSCDATNMDGHNKKENLNMIDVAPQLMWSVINQLTNVCGIPQKLICIGDPSAYFPDQYHDLLKTDFPEVVYISCEKGAEGRTKIISSAEQVMHFSNGSGGDYLPVQFTEADYMINISVTKHHGSAGFTQIAKNHYGSNMRNSAEHMHSSLVNVLKGYGKYRHFVDLLGHKDLGGKTILNIGDFLWSGHDAWTTPVKFTTAPFLSDYPSSLLVSIDPLAVESVGMDFVQTQVWSDQLATSRGVDDYLFQAADSAYWPEGILYDPEGDGTILESLGVFEHWDNGDDKQYTGNKGIPGGIELVMSVRHMNIVSPTEFTAEYVEEPVSVVLTWKDLSDGEDAYVIERTEGTGVVFTILAQTGPDDTSYTDSTIEPGITYHYRIHTRAGSVTTIAETVTLEAPSPAGDRVTLQEEIPFSIFPNPVSECIYIICEMDAIITGIRIYDLNGQVQEHLKPDNPFGQDILMLDCRNLIPGCHLIQIDSNYGSRIFPLLVAR